MQMRLPLRGSMTTKSPKIFWWLISSVAVIAAFLVFSEASFSKAFNRDIFPTGRPTYLEISNTFHKENFAWSLVGPSKLACLRWVKENEWSERITWQKSLGDPANPERRMIDLILSRHDVNFSNIDTVYTGIVDGSDVGYLIIFKESVDEKYFGIICVFRT
jgi:hypothetical protein